MTDDIPAALLAAFAHHGDVATTARQLADLAGLSEAEVQRLLESDAALARLMAHKARLEADGATLPARARRTLAKALASIDRQLDAGADGFEAADLARPLIRLLENSERVRLAEREDNHKRLTTVHISIINGAVQLKAVPPKDADVPDAIEVPARQIGGPA